MSKISLEIGALTVESFDVAGDPSQWLRAPLTDDIGTDCCDENVYRPITVGNTRDECCDIQ
ncbi:MAG TPA: hypothetical protein VHG93_24555 [Longimicrobium sp.]|nr:hypothetical protein [Longimicrobium sp.]